ncbi:zinc dependent phospholipase C family protein [Paenibacillus thermotolerans]|uniref:zinc dependent phospholipase C family protein n=1 Tax=Paenibacillus thermotolerans TaxID=3027807 RepID=UPI002367EDF1|nr:MULTISPECIES: zinc dependent phospholipase C family protein [unclassified Paenibacillus]
MPNIWTHFIWGEEVLKRLQIAEPVLKSPREAALFRFGCQGPDLLFYHRFYPWMKQQAAFAGKLGSVMHKKRCGLFLGSLLEDCAGLPLHHPKTVYTLGFLAHHVLDRQAHPFVFAREGSRSRDHQRLEVALDTLVAERERGIQTRFTPVAPYLYSGAALDPEVASALTKALLKTYPEYAGRVSDDLWNESYRDMLAANRIFHDPYGVKRILTGGAIEPFVPGRRTNPADAANERRDEWRPPAAKENTSRESFWDVWNRSFDDGERVLKAAVDWLRAANEHPDRMSAAWDEFRLALGDLSYETGLACEA